jgi:tetratricopeptide (TPR) repeat protein
LEDPRTTSGALNIFVEVARAQGDRERALALAEEAVALRRTLGDEMLVADSTYRLGVAAFEFGDLDRAEDAFETSLELAVDLGDALYRAANLCLLGTISVLRDELMPASARLRESLSIYTELEDRRSTAECLCALGAYAAAAGRPEEAARLWGGADSARGENPLEYAEPVIEARFTPVLVEALGAERFAELRAEGERHGYERVLAESRELVASTRAE